ncbi:MAG: Holliday junction branch migration protein RuvA [Alphaproteobacteria bacterium]|nr:Holliday junction branch migration protein RuvA [Alphaproteobacteria bacterium]
MIGKLKGIVEETGDDHALLDVGGVGYIAYCSSRTLAMLEPGTAAQLFIETHVREDHIHLYGFASPEERSWFRILTTVQGVGAKVGLAILSALSPLELSQAIAAQDKTLLSRANGVGPKLAARLVTELKDKAPAFSTSAMSLPPQRNVAVVGADSVQEAASALANLGYGRTEALSAAARAAAMLGEKASTESILRHALKEMATA